MICTRLSITTVVIFASLTLQAWGQAAIHKPGTVGRIDPNTGTFKPFTAVVEDSPEAAAINAATTFGGTLVFTISIAIKSTNLPSTDTIGCSADAFVSDVNPTTFALAGDFEEEAAVQATRTSSTTATCTVRIPYAWPLSFQSTDMVSRNITVSVPGFFTSTTNALPNRIHTRSLPSIKVPANGATTSVSIAVVI